MAKIYKAYHQERAPVTSAIDRLAVITKGSWHGFTFQKLLIPQRKDLQQDSASALAGTMRSRQIVGTSSGGVTVPLGATSMRSQSGGFPFRGKKSGHQPR